MTHDRDPFDGPSPAGPLGNALRDLTADAPPAGFTESAIRRRVGERSAFRRQILGGVAAAVVGVGVVTFVVTTFVNGAGSTTSSAASSSAVSSSAAAASSSSASSSAGSLSRPSSAAASSSSAAASTGPTVASTAASSGGPDGGSAVPPGNAPGATPQDAATGAECRSAPLSDPARQAVEGAIPGLTPAAGCASDDADLALQRWTLADGSLVAELRAGVYDPCADGSAGCTDVPDRPGVRTAEVNGATMVWVSGRDGSVVLTAAPAGVLPVATLADAATALAAAGP